MPAFKSALDHVTAEDTLVEKTRLVLLDAKAEPARKFRAVSPMAKRAVAAACGLFVLCSLSIGSYAYYQKPVSYLSLDINPSVELGINAFNRVVSATGYNEDGKTILDGQKVRNKNVRDAVSTLVKSASKSGFIAGDGSTVIAVTAETDSDSTAKTLEDAAADGANGAVREQGSEAVVQKENVALERRDEARKLGITPGKLNLIQKLQKLDPSITVDQYKDAKVTQIMKKFVELKTALKDGGQSSSAVSSGSGSTVSSSSSFAAVVSAASEDAKQNAGQSSGKGKSNAGSAASGQSTVTAGISGNGNAGGNSVGNGKDGQTVAVPDTVGKDNGNGNNGKGDQNIAAVASGASGNGNAGGNSDKAAGAAKGNGK